MLILAGVAFRDAGVLVLLLLVGVIPLKGEKMSDLCGAFNGSMRLLEWKLLLQYLAPAPDSGP